MNRKLLTVSILLCIITLLFVGTSQAQTITPGVRPGMVFIYNLSSFWTSADPYDSIPSDLITVNQTSYVEIRISEVTDTHITTSNIYYSIDGSHSLDRGVINLSTGEVSNFQTHEAFGFAAIIGANLQVGDKIHPNGEDTLTILDTTTRNYENGARTVNHVRIVNDNQADGYIATRNLYFDKETGILVEQIDRTETTTYPVNIIQVTWKLDHVINVDGWITPEFNFPTSTADINTKDGKPIEFYLIITIPVLLTITAITIIIIHKKKQQTQNNN